MFKYSTNASRQLLVAATLCSIILTWLELIPQNPFNVDGILYLHAADVYLQQGYQACLAVYKWPFFSIAIAWLSRLTSLSLEHTAYIINASLQVLLVITFIQLTAALNGSRWHCRIAALIILLYPYLNGIRGQIIRDFGYWAFALLAVLWLLRYSQTWRLRYALGWACAMFLAGLFRIEGLLFLYTAPCLLLFQNLSWQQRWRGFIGASIIPLLFLLILASLHQHGHHFDHTTSSSRLSELTTQLQQGFTLMTTGFQQLSLTIQQHVLNSQGTESSMLFLFGGLTAVFIVTFIQALTPVYTILCGYGMTTQKMPASRNDKIIILGFIKINLLLLLFFIAQKLFIDKRYLVFLAILCMLWLPATLVDLLATIRQHHGSWSGKKCFMLISILALLLAAIGGIVRFGYSKAYITQAGLWLQHNTPTTITLYSNSPEVLYYAKREHANWQALVNQAAPLISLDSNQWQKYDYLAIRINHKDSISAQDIIKELHRHPIKIFANTRQDQVLIFKTEREDD